MPIQVLLPLIPAERAWHALVVAHIGTELVVQHAQLMLLVVMVQLLAANLGIMDLIVLNVRLVLYLELGQVKPVKLALLAPLFVVTV